MNLLLDTHALLWWLAGSRMTVEARDQIADGSNAVAVSAASVWEIAIKRAIGKLRLRGSIVDHIRDGGFDALAVSGEHAERAGALPPHHRDPFDRVLVAQAQLKGLVIVTRDPSFAAYDVEVLAC